MLQGPPAHQPWFARRATIADHANLWCPVNSQATPYPSSRSSRASQPTTRNFGISFKIARNYRPVFGPFCNGHLWRAHRPLLPRSSVGGRSPDRATSRDRRSPHVLRAPARVSLRPARRKEPTMHNPPTSILQFAIPHFAICNPFRTYSPLTKHPPHKTSTHFLHFPSFPKGNRFQMRKPVPKLHLRQLETNPSLKKSEKGSAGTTRGRRTWHGRETVPKQTAQQRGHGSLRFLPPKNPPGLA